MTNHAIPKLPPHYYQSGKSTWDAAAYCTNAIDADDRQGNRVALIESAVTDYNFFDHGTFCALKCVTSTSHRYWIWRAGADSALYYKESKGNADKGFRKAISDQIEIDKLRSKA